MATDGRGHKGGPGEQGWIGGGWEAEAEAEATSWVESADDQGQKTIYVQHG